MSRYFFKLFIVFLLFFFVQNIYGQEPDKKISPKDYYDFFNSFINPDSIHYFNLASNPDFSQILHDSLSIYDDTSLFSFADVQFIKAQISNGQNFKWKSNKIIGSKVISSKKIARFFKNGPDEGWAEFNKQYKNGFATFSIPLFSVDKNICIVYRASHCGSLCGSGNIRLYKKIDGKWTFVQVIGMIWIS